MPVSQGIYKKRKAMPHKWVKAIDALLATSTIAEAASAARMPLTTINRWLSHCPDFVAEYQRRSRMAFSSGMARGVAMTRDSFAVLRELMDYAADPEIRLEACKLVMDYAFRAVELDELTARLDRLEQATGQGGAVAQSPTALLLQQITSRMLPGGNGAGVAPAAGNGPTNGVPPAPPEGATAIDDTSRDNSEEDGPPSGHGEDEGQE